jgi:hypothetical protein
MTAGAVLAGRSGGQSSAWAGVFPQSAAPRSALCGGLTDGQDGCSGLNRLVQPNVCSPVAKWVRKVRKGHCLWSGRAPVDYFGINVRVPRGPAAKLRSPRSTVTRTSSPRSPASRIRPRAASLNSRTSALVWVGMMRLLSGRLASCGPSGRSDRRAPARVSVRHAPCRACHRHGWHHRSRRSPDRG